MGEVKFTRKGQTATVQREEDVTTGGKWRGVQPYIGGLIFWWAQKMGAKLG